VPTSAFAPPLDDLKEKAVEAYAPGVRVGEGGRQKEGCVIKDAVLLSRLQMICTLHFETG
jgi:hypothetical protein